MKRDLYFGWSRFCGEEHENTLSAAFNYATSLGKLKHYREAKGLLLRNIPVARRILGEGHKITLKMRWTYATALYMDPAATLDDLREAVATLEDVERIARRVFGGAHPTTTGIEGALRRARAVLRSPSACALLRRNKKQ